MAPKKFYGKLSFLNNVKKKSSSARKRAAPKKKKAPSRSAGNYGADIGGAIGHMIGGSSGSKVGRALGTGAAGLFSRITGRGDYKVSSNSILKGTDPPSFSRNGRGTIVRHREYIADITGSTAFTLTSFPINPGLSSTFPWLSAVAQNYEEYVIRGLVFEFKSTSANALNSTNTALGTVIMATRYNVLAGNFSNKTEMENYEFSTSIKPSESAMHPIECAVGESPLHVLYVRSGVAAAGDLRLYDIGNFQIATVGMQAAANIGELWCTYDVELLKPKVTGISGIPDADHIRFSTTNYGTTNPFGDTPLISSESSFGCLVTGGVGACTIIVPDWPQDYYFLVSAQWTGTNTAIGSAHNPTSVTSVVVRSTCLTNNSVAFVSTPASTTGASFYFAVYRFISGPTTFIAANRTITWNSPTGLTGFTGGDMYICSIPPPKIALSLSIEDSKEKVENVEEQNHPDFESYLEDIDDEQAQKLFSCLQKKIKFSLPEPPKEGKEEKKSDPPPKGWFA